MDKRKKALLIYLAGALGQIFITCVAVFCLRGNGRKVDYTNALGMLAIGMGGISSALWGAVVSIRYRGSTLKEIFVDFLNVKQSYKGYALVLAFLVLDFGSVLLGGSGR